MSYYASEKQLLAGKLIEKPIGTAKKVLLRLLIKRYVRYNLKYQTIQRMIMLPGDFSDNIRR